MPEARYRSAPVFLIRMAGVPFDVLEQLATPDTAKAVTEIKGGKIEFRVDKHSNLHFIIGKTSFDDSKLVENYAAALEEITRLKPSAAKGRYIKKAAISTTMGPGIPVDPNRTRNLLVEEDPAAV